MRYTFSGPLHILHKSLVDARFTYDLYGRWVFVSLSLRFVNVSFESAIPLSYMMPYTHTHVEAAVRRLKSRQKKIAQRLNKRKIKVCSRCVHLVMQSVLQIPKDMKFIFTNYIHFFHVIMCVYRLKDVGKKSISNGYTFKSSSSLHSFTF